MKYRKKPGPERQLPDGQHQVIIRESDFLRLVKIRASPKEAIGITIHRLLKDKEETDMYKAGVTECHLICLVKAMALHGESTVIDLLSVARYAGIKDTTTAQAVIDELTKLYLRIITSEDKDSSAALCESLGSLVTRTEVESCLPFLEELVSTKLKEMRRKAPKTMDSYFPAPERAGDEP